MDYYADSIGDLLVNDAIFPAQWADGRRPALSVEQLLWLAVLSDAIHWATAKEPMSNNQRRLRYEAENWILAPFSPRARVGSLQFVCEALNVSAEAVRERVRARKVVRIPKHMHVASGRQTRVGATGHARAVRQGV